MVTAIEHSSRKVDRVQSCLKSSRDGGLVVEKSRDGIWIVLPPGACSVSSSILEGAMFRCEFRREGDINIHQCSM
jgi:hypothetical protein